MNSMDILIKKLPIIVSKEKELKVITNVWQK